MKDLIEEHVVGFFECDEVFDCLLACGELAELLVVACGYFGFVVGFYYHIGRFKDWEIEDWCGHERDARASGGVLSFECLVFSWGLGSMVCGRVLW